MSLHAARSARARIATLDDGWDLHEPRPLASAGPAPAPAEPVADLDDGWGLQEEDQRTAPAYAAVAFSSDELAFFDAGEELARPAPVETFADLPAPPRRGFWRRLLSRD
jgi:hypothetical protein